MWTYDLNDLDESTETGRKNIVRLLVGDTDITDQQVQDEEILFALSAEGDSVYGAGALVARTLASKFARLVDIDLDGQLSESYSQLRTNYTILAEDLSREKVSKTASMGLSAGGVSVSEMNRVNLLVDRVKPQFKRDSYQLVKEE